MRQEFPKTQRAVQLVGRDELLLNEAKPLPPPGPHQLVCQVEAVGLCFSDLKLIKQFSDHARKSVVTSGIEEAVLAEIPSYVPGELPTVPGHEAVVRVAAVGSAITRWKPGERYLVQTDYRWLTTAAANAAFGYDFEGGLQEYVLMDERVIVSPAGESMLLPVPESLSASSVALVEPWACVEEAYAERPRQTLKEGGTLLVVAEGPPRPEALTRLLQHYGTPSEVTWIAPEEVAALPEASVDDAVCFGANAAVVEAVFPKLAPQALLNLVLEGARFARPVATPVGRVHYNGIRIVGTTGMDPAESMPFVPEASEIRTEECVQIVGAGGPMGVMHVLRTICLGRSGVRVFAADLDARRLAHLDELAGQKAAAAGVHFRAYDPTKGQVADRFTYVVVMVPAPALVAQAVLAAGPGAIVNVFGGIPVQVNAEVDLNAYVEKHLYFVGTSGSTVADMQAVLARMEAGLVDTDLSVAAVCGLEGAIEGIRAVERNLLPGKIVVYPACRGMGLTPVRQVWNRAAEQALWEQKR